MRALDLLINGVLFVPFHMHFINLKQNVQPLHHSEVSLQLHEAPLHSKHVIIITRNRKSPKNKLTSN